MRISILALGRKQKGKRSSRSKVRRKQKGKISSQSKVERRQKKKKIPNQRSEESKRRKFPIKGWKKAKNERRIPDQRSEENKRKYTRRSLDQTISKQYRIVTTKQEKKGNHDWKWSSPFDYQPKSCAPATFSRRTKPKQKRKRPKHSEPNFPPKTPFPKKSY